MFVPYGKTSKGEIPIGLASVRYEQCGKSRHSYPHVVWFPEASRRNRLECALKFLIELKNKSLVLISARAGEVEFFDHLCKYGVLRGVGKIWSYFGPGEDAVVFQGVTS